MKKWYMLFVAIIMVLAFGACKTDAKAMETETHTIGEFALTHEDGDVQKTAVIAKQLENGNWAIELEKKDFWFITGSDKKTHTFHVKFTVKENPYCNPTSITYKEEVSVMMGSGTECFIDMMADRGNGEEYLNAWFFVGIEHAQFEIESLVSSATKKGFHPSKGNYLTFRSAVFSDVQIKDYYELGVEFRILNSKGETVYIEDYGKFDYGIYWDLDWDGKHYYTKSYVKDGKYKAEISVILRAHNTTVKESKAISFKVSRKAPKGTKGLAKAKDIVTLTGNPEIDYMAEQMVKAAGVKMSMSDEQKVKKIYHYMTKKFKHTHYKALNNKYKAYYNLKKLTPKIIKYMKKTNKLLAKGELVYNYQYGYTTTWCMQRRRGVCDDHAEIFKILCNHVGVEAGVCGGYYLNRSGSKEAHAWNYAIVNGKKYYYDVDVEIQNYKKGQGDYYWYRKTKKQAKKNHKFKYES